MRTWSFEEDGYYKAMILVDGQTTGWVKKEDAQFIIDACNAAEAAQEQPMTMAEFRQTRETGFLVKDL